MEYAHELFDACVYLYIYVKPNSGNGRADYEYGNVQGPWNRGDKEDPLKGPYW